MINMIEEANCHQRHPKERKRDPELTNDLNTLSFFHMIYITSILLVKEIIAH